MSGDVSFEGLWDSGRSGAGPFELSRVAALPPGAQRYLRHAIAAGTPMASAVRLTMHGEIKLKQWNAFKAEEVIHWGRGFMWRATVRMGWAFMRGGDSFVDGTGAMRWRLFGVIPVVSASGSDVTRSAGIPRSNTWPVEERSRKKEASAGTPSRPACASAGISEPSGSSPRASSSG